MSDSESATIVLINDDAAICDLMLLALSRQNPLWRIFIAADGQAGLEMVTRVKPDLIVLDNHMPVMDGYEMLTRLKDNPDLSDIPVIMILPTMPQDAVRFCQQLGVEIFFPMPYIVSDFVSAAQKVLANVG